MIDPLIAATVSIGLGLMFLFAAWHKLADRPQFRVTLLEYQLLPEALVAPAALVVPLVETVLGSSWLIGYLPHELTALASAGLLTGYALAIAINLYRGRVYFDCGCGFGRRHDKEQYLSGGLIVRNAVLIILSLTTLLPTAARTLGIGDYLTLGAALLACLLLFGAANQLLANRASINTWRKPRD
jgi:hypothetical protein